MPCAITLKSNGALAGWLTLTKTESDRRRGSLGYWLGTQYHGQGFAREALNALLSAGFNFLDLDIIEAGAQPENLGSFALMRACGMAEIGKRMVHATARQRDELCVFYEISHTTFDRISRVQEIV